LRWRGFSESLSFAGLIFSLGGQRRWRLRHYPCARPTYRECQCKARPPAPPLKNTARPLRTRLVPEVPYGTLTQSILSFILCFFLPRLEPCCGHRQSPNLKTFSRTQTGALATFNDRRDITRATPSFNPGDRIGRSCGTCHQANQAFSISAKVVREVYERTHGRSRSLRRWCANCPYNTSRRREAPVLCWIGLIRIGIQPAVKPQFTIAVWHYRTGCATRMTDDGTARGFRLYVVHCLDRHLRYLSA